jgi:dynein intermediate chain 1, axonemal
MPPRKVRKAAGRAARRRPDDDDEEDNLQDDDELINNEANMPMSDQIELTAEEKDQTIFKVLNTKNPQAPHNLTEFSWKDRHYKTMEIVDQIVVHYNVEGTILLQDSDEAREQEEFHEKKKATDNALLNKINKAIKDAGKKVPHDGEEEQKKSLRNMFNYQERTS